MFSSLWRLRITGKFPGYLSPSAGLKFADVPNGLAAISKVPAAGWGQILAYMAFCEVSQDQSPGTPAAAGDFGFKVLTSSDPAEKTKKLSAELANGRLAMMAIIGMFFQAGFHNNCMLGGTSCLLVDEGIRTHFTKRRKGNRPIKMQDCIRYADEGCWKIT